MDNNEKAIRTAYPGRSVDLGNGLTVRVFPAGFKHIREFTRNIGNIMQRIRSVQLTIDEKTEQFSAQTAQRLGVVFFQALSDDLFDLIRKCCTPDIDEIPHWCVPMVLVAWIEENFLGENKLHPWVQAIERLTREFTGVEVQLWETFSRLWSPAAIASVTSSIRDSLGSHTKAGPSSSGGSGATTPSSSGTVGEPTSSATFSSPLQPPRTTEPSAL